MKNGMKNAQALLLDQFVALRTYKNENFGSIPDDYRQMIEDILAKNGSAAFMLGTVASAATNFPAFIESLKKSGFAKIMETEDEDTHIGVAQIDGDKANLGGLIRENWNLFEPGFLMLYLGMKIGRQMERTEHKALESITRAEAREEARKKNPELAEVKPEQQTLLPAVSDSTDHPAISPEKAEMFRQEMEEAMRQEREKGN
jgi:hypothetical protein